MKHNTMSQREHAILCNLSQLPRKMLALHNHDSITDLVLHDLCGKQCFNLSKAAYLVDNPDFNCVKGIAGYSQSDAGVVSSCNMWENPDQFSKQIHDLPFNQQVRNIERCSLKKGVHAELDLAHEIAHDLGIEKPQYCLWSMKHDNHGILIFEKPEQCDNCAEDYVVNGCSLLGFCPIF